MLIDYIGVKEINGSLIVLDDVEGASFEEMVEIRLEDGSIRQGRVVQIDGKRVVIQVFEGCLLYTSTRSWQKLAPCMAEGSPERIFRPFWNCLLYTSRCV